MSSFKAVAALLLSSALPCIAAAPPTALDVERYRALEPGATGSEAIAHVLADYHRRGDGVGGFAWWMTLPIAVRSRQAPHTEARRWRNRIEFLRDAERRDAVGCAVSGRPVLDDPELGCDYAIELTRYRACIEGLPAERRLALTDALKPSALARLDADAARCESTDAISAARAAITATPP